MDKVLLDTGSAGTLFNADLVRDIGVVPERNDVVDTIRGVGGVEVVFPRALILFEMEKFRCKDLKSR